ncbi:MAG: type transport system ATP-binding protein [Solirubrobacteraceae bacterium]|jgi:predicted acyl esterase|nr:type transport system ATP-binding protein [Solirubrobacteraceae bacterium]
MGRVIALLGVLSSALALALPGAASAATPITDYFAAGAGLPCPIYAGDQICSGEVPSFDGAKLDVDLTLPATGGPGTRHPLIVMLHGFGNNKHEWESSTNAGDGADKYDWNSHWFAQHGYYVLTYTARGFRDDGTTGAYQPNTPSGAPFGSLDPSSPNGTIHVKSRDYEIRDTQWLAALVAAAYPAIDPSEVAVTGGSYGGGESWMQASQAQWTFPHEQDPGLPVLDLQVAVPKYPWTDLAYSLAPNGHGGGPSRNDIYESSQAVQSSDTGGGTPATGSPLGVPKASYVAGLFAEGTANGAFDVGTDTPPPTNENGPENIPAWNTRITGVGDPYVDGDPILQQAARGLTELRSAYYQDELWPQQVGQREVAVFSISGWTDDLFEPIESFRMFKYLKRLDPMWPVSVAVADVGHSPAQNKPATWHRLNDQAFQFLQANINGSHRQQTTVSSQRTICAGDPGQGDSLTAADNVTATSPEGLSSGALSITYGGGTHTLTNPLGAIDPNGPATDPIVGADVIEPHQGCSTDQGPAVGGYTGVSDPLPNETTYVGLGEVDVQYALTPGTQAQLDARVWDVPPTGPAYLITRGTYRFDTLNGYDSPAGDVRLPLFGNDWRLAPGHRIRLDLTQVDQPYLRPNDTPSSITFGTPTLVLPTREAGQRALTGSP